MKTWTLIINTRDTISGKTWDRLEVIAQGKTLWKSDNGAGGLTICIKPTGFVGTARRKAIIAEIQAICPRSRWEEQN